jgi:hypothetical protein
MVWIDPSTLPSVGTLQAATDGGNTTTNSILLQSATPPSLFYDNTVNTKELAAGAITSNTVVSLPDLTSTLVGTVAGLSNESVVRGIGTHSISSASFKDDGANTWFGGSVNPNARISVNTTEIFGISVVSTHTASAAYGYNVAYNQSTAFPAYGYYADVVNGGSGIASAFYANSGDLTVFSYI